MLRQIFLNRLHLPSIVIAFCVVAMLAGPSSALSSAPLVQESGPDADSPIVESAHPYANDFNDFWTIEMPGAQATRIHFSRIELEDPADYLIISDPSDTRTQVITGSYPNGLWTDPVPGSYVRIRLVTDVNVRKWGFAVDQKEAVSYAGTLRSPHPYLNNTNQAWTVLNSDPSPGPATKIHFSRIELEQNVDWLILSDVSGNPYQYITGSHPGGLWSNGIPGIAVKVQLVTDANVERWGFNVDSTQSASASPPQSPAAFPTLAESDHPYTPGQYITWILTNPDANAVSSKIHFTRLNLGVNSFLQILDANDTVIQEFGGPSAIDLQDVWTDYVPGRIVKVYLGTAAQQAWGFRVDRIVDSVTIPVLAQSDHPYTSGQYITWILTNPNPAAVSSKIHFTRLNLGVNSFLQILDANDTVIQEFGGPSAIDLQDVWTDYVPGRIVKVYLGTAAQRAWGFRIDRILDSVTTPVLAQSDHPYTSGQYITWILTNPNSAAVSSKIHFTRLNLGVNSFLQILDANDTVVQTFGGPSAIDLQDVWTDYVPGRIVKVYLGTAAQRAWGFRIDEIYPATADPITLAAITGVYINVVHPGRIYLNNVEVAYAQEPGEYKILLPGFGEYVIRIEYIGYTQEIRVAVGEDSGLSILYLPLVQTNR